MRQTEAVPDRHAGGQALAENVRRAIWILIVGTACLATGELLLRFGENPLISVAQFACIGVFFGLLFFLRRQDSWRGEVSVALLATATSALTTPSTFSSPPRKDGSLHTP